jgi:hypothetical protein
MRSSLVVRASATVLVRSQHPPTQWNLRGRRWSSVDRIVIPADLNTSSEPQRSKLRSSPELNSSMLRPVCYWTLIKKDVYHSHYLHPPLLLPPLPTLNLIPSPHLCPHTPLTKTPPIPCNDLVHPRCNFHRQHIGYTVEQGHSNHQPGK